MNAVLVPAIAAMGIGALFLAYSAYFAISSVREYRRRVTVAVEMLGALKLDAGPSWRFRVVGEGVPPRPEGKPEWIASTPRKFGDRTFTPGEIVRVDLDPGYPGFIYPPGGYPPCRMWPAVAVTAVAGLGSVVAGLLLLG
ncbi:hypothetical protein LUW75_08845 [Streptomyces sp. MRC013]|uniref:hypothetical protein n=1 Tax=Streptomyces sp. MRC013 TaxID=2898276 RepID=UPI00202643C9|nr:hypothetical protein [Streptomyces sp. MRC013]URM90079.1 hypothetical protein LUW75_08845 [Streptomyces sp. MRC013]